MTIITDSKSADSGSIPERAAKLTELDWKTLSTVYMGSNPSSPTFSHWETCSNVNPLNMRNNTRRYWNLEKKGLLRVIRDSDYDGPGLIRFHYTQYQRNELGYQVYQYYLDEKYKD